jgi:hypothetical protein
MDFLKNKVSTRSIYFPLLQRWTLFDWFFPLLLILDGKSIRWMWKLIFFMDTYLKKFSWNNHFVLLHIVPCFLDSISHSVVLIRLPKLGIQRSIVYFLNMVSNVVNIITTYLYSLPMEMLWFIFFICRWTIDYCKY